MIVHKFLDDKPEGQELPMFLNNNDYLQGLLGGKNKYYAEAGINEDEEGMVPIGELKKMGVSRIFKFDERDGVLTFKIAIPYKNSLQGEDPSLLKKSAEELYTMNLEEIYNSFKNHFSEGNTFGFLKDQESFNKEIGIGAIFNLNKDEGHLVVGLKKNTETHMPYLVIDFLWQPRLEILTDKLEAKNLVANVIVDMGYDPDKIFDLVKKVGEAYLE